MRESIGRIEPRVIKLAETSVDQSAVRELARYYAANDWLKKTRRYKRSDSELLTELAGRVCYRSFGTQLNPNITRIRENPREYLHNVLKSRHGSVLEHSSVTFCFLDVSRVFTHELVRHRSGTAISQESLRYVRPHHLDLWIPADLSPVSREFIAIFEQVRNGYRRLEASFPWKEMSFAEKKRITSALRRILPTGLATNIIWTANHRTIRWVIEMRTEPSAEVEIRRVFGLVAHICIQDYPFLYGDFQRRALDDGTYQYLPKFSKV